jgi:AraC family transcriptional regulator
MQNVSRLFIKGMVCQRCINVIKQELEQSGIPVIKVDLGEVTVISSNNAAQTRLIEERLLPLGFRLLEDKKIKTLNTVKDLVAQVYSGHYDFPNSFRFSDLVVSRLHKDYDAVSSLFSLLEHKTLERFIIDHRIEKIKEFLVYSDLTLSDISFKLNFSSVAHLSRQFKQNTGLTPSYFKEIKKAKIMVEFSEN